MDYIVLLNVLKVSPTILALLVAQRYSNPTPIPSTKSHCRKGKWSGRTQNDRRQEMKSSKLTGNQIFLYTASEVNLSVANEGVSMQAQNVFH